MKGVRANLKIGENFAQHFAQEPSLGDIPQNGWRQAQQYHKEVSHRQVYNEYIRHSPHWMVRVDRQADERISDLKKVKNCFVIFWKVAFLVILAELL